MNKLRIPFTVILTLVVMAIVVSAYGSLELAEPAAETGAVSAPDIEVLRHNYYQAFKADGAAKVGATDELGMVDIEVLRNRAYQAFKAEAASKPEMVDIEVLRNRAYQAFNAEAASKPETVDIEVLRHNYYSYLRAAETDAATKVVAADEP
jgi:hypothetical protein